MASSTYRRGYRRPAHPGFTISFSTPGRPQTITADRVILCMSFAARRTLDYAAAGFDQRKQTAITQLGAGRNAKLELQFGRRPWSAQGSTGNAFTDLGFPEYLGGDTRPGRRRWDPRQLLGGGTPPARSRR